MPKKRVLTGDRTVGRLHLGHYVGSLASRVTLQNEYETFIMLADIQSLTMYSEQTDTIRENVLQVALDNLAVGLDPEKVTLIQQSSVDAIMALAVIFSTLVKVSTVLRNPTIRTELRQLGGEPVFGFLAYPLAQAADITFCKADLVPVGADQLPHIELTRKIVRRFNELYTDGKELLKLPIQLLSTTPRLTGLDGKGKMSNQSANAVYLSDSTDTVCRKVLSAVTDRSRVTLRDKGNPDICMVSYYHKVFNPHECRNVCELCRSAGISCVACKKLLSDKLNGLLEPIRDRRDYYEQHLGGVREYIEAGSEKAKRIGDETLEQVKSAMRLRV